MLMALQVWSRSWHLPDPLHQYFAISIKTPGLLPGQWQKVGSRNDPLCKSCRLSIPAFEPQERRALRPFCFECMGIMRVWNWPLRKKRRIILFFYSARGPSVRAKWRPRQRSLHLLASNVAVDDVFEIFLTAGLWLRVDVIALDHGGDLVQLQFAAKQLLGVG